ncbi:hypothetical protein [Labrys monachus]|uniref:Uncharacterized protein n=1 Tax=Labrys monachus TaxID=217067 RepID=A0ABU0FJ79_9HYPH|nr:hypothetical protein [Labrys monachus]MDQ0394397.1 hypothetical protein [Labrys monachus]
MARIVRRALLSAALMLGAGAALYVAMGICALSAVLFAVACGVISEMAAYM